MSCHLTRTQVAALLLGLVIVVVPVLSQDPTPPKDPAKPTFFQGKLTDDSPFDTVRKESRCQVHEVKLEAGKVYVIDLQSKEFDTFLRVENAEKKQLAFNDDISEKNLNSRLIFAPGKTADHRLIATSFQPTGRGTYTVQLREATPLGKATVLEGKLTEKSPMALGQHFEKHLIELSAGRFYRITLESPDFDAVLVLRDPAGKPVASNRVPKGVKAGVLAAVGKDEVRTVTAMALGQGDIGNYQLTIQAYGAGGPPAPAPGEIVLPDVPPTVIYGQLTAKDSLDPVHKQSHHKVHTVRMEKGKLYFISRAGELLPHLRVEDAQGKILGPGGEEIGPGGRRSYAWLPFVPARSEDYRVIVTTAPPGQTGAYLLSVQVFAQGDRFRSRLDQEVRAQALLSEGSRHLQSGDQRAASFALQQSLALLQKLYPEKDYPRSHPDVSVALLWLGIAYLNQGEFGPARASLQQALVLRQKLYPEKDYPHGHIGLAACLNKLGETYNLQGQYRQARPFLQQSLEMVQRLYSEKDHPNGHPVVASTLTSMGSLLQHLGEYAGAGETLQRSLAMHRRLFPEKDYPNGDHSLAVTLQNLGAVFQAQGEWARALPHHQEALDMLQKLYPERSYPHGHLMIAANLDHLGSVLEELGEFGRAREYYQKGLATMRNLYPEKQYPNGHPHLMNPLNNLGHFFARQGEFGRAREHYQQALAMGRKLYPEKDCPDGHPALAIGLHNLGDLFVRQGEYGLAEAHINRARTMFRKLYPESNYRDGHPHLTLSPNSLAYLFAIQRQYDRARDSYQQTLTLLRKLYPEKDYPSGHPHLAATLNNLGHLSLVQGTHDKACDYFQKALTMLQKLYPEEHYPRGHLELTRPLHNLGFSLTLQGEYAQARDCQQQAQTLLDQLYPAKDHPNGHPELIHQFEGWGRLFHAQGRHKQARDWYRQLLRLHQGLLGTFASTASEAEALNYLPRQVNARGLLLTITLHHLPTQAAVQDYELIWQSRGAISHLLQRRQALLQGIDDPELRRQAERLVELRQQVARLLLATPLKGQDEHLALLRKRTEDKEDLERQLAQKIPQLKREQALLKAPHTRLLSKLPEHTVLLDILSYSQYDARKDRAIDSHYVAFVLASGAKQVVCVPLGPAKDIEEPLKRWREDIAAHRQGTAGEELRRRLWDKLEAELPKGTKTIYIAPDDALHSLPWAALPGSAKGKVLLEDYTLAIVPHGPFLLDQLENPPELKGPPSLLAVGNVRYDQEPLALKQDERLKLRSPDVNPPKAGWLNLSGTAKELDQLLGLAKQHLPGASLGELRGQEAGTAQLGQKLRGVRIAHLATHGFFAAPKTDIRKGLFEDRMFVFGSGGDRLMPGTRSPLVQTGLVMAGANVLERSDTSDGGLMTGEAIASLPLQKLHLAVLSACETGLGEADLRGEGIHGLQRAFHLAGARNVVASLWKVDDEATAALMGLFYRNLWVKGQNPLEALRNAQLALLRHPEEIASLARGQNPFAQAVQRIESPQPVPSGERKTTPVRQWAAFLLSGSGQ